MTNTDTGTYAPHLTVVGGALDGKQLVCAPGVEKLLGTGTNCQLQVQGANVDPVHARVIWEMRGLLLTDLGSNAGTYVNGERVAADQPLNDGDRVCLGPPGARQSVKLLVYVPPDVAAASSGAAAAKGAPHTPSTPVPPITLVPPPAPHAEEPPPLVLLEVDAPPVPIEAPAAPVAPPAPPRPATPPPFAPVAAPAPPTPPPAPPRAVEPPAQRDKPAKVPKLDVGDALSSLDVPGWPAAAATAATAAAPTSAPAPARGTAKTAAARPSRGLRLPSLALPRPVLIGVATLVLALAVLGAYVWLHQPPPVVLTLSPPIVEPGGSVTLTGAGFATTATANVVRFGERQADVVSTSDTRLVVTVPALDVSRGAQNVSVSVETRGARVGGLFLKVVALPKVTALEPEVALPGDEVAVVGRNLGAAPVRVSLGGNAVEPLEARPERVRFRVPDMPVTLGRSLPVSVSVAGETAQAPALVLGRLPLLLSVEPASGPAGTRVVLRGRGLAADPASLQVTVQGRRALVLSAADAELAVIVPGVRQADVQVSAPVIVSTGGASSNAREFTLTSPASTAFVPRFFAAEAADAPGQVLVATDLGPVLALGDKGDAPSLGERALRTAEALNALVDAVGKGAPAALEVRDAPQPALWATGATQPLVSVLPADVAAYDRRARGASGGARKLAAFWGALIEDYLTLFVQGQRPSRVAELSSRGKVLLDLYAEATRRSRGATGVPRSLVLPPSAALEAGLRDLALLPEGGGRAAVRAATPIEGVWEGTLDEQDSGTRRMQLTLRLVGGRLQGDATTRSRGLGMSIPLADISYERGTLKFTLVSGGVPRTFVGTLQGAKVSGTIQVPGRKDPIGRFSLDFVQ